MLLDDIQSNTGLSAPENANQQANSSQSDVSPGLMVNQKMFKKKSVSIIKPWDYNNDSNINAGDEKDSKLSDPDVLDREVEITLSETSTRAIFCIPSTVPCKESEDEQTQTVSANEKYKTVLAKHTDGDLFSTSECQTYNLPMKQRGIQAIPAPVQHESTQASKWQIHDALTEQDSKKQAESNNVKADCDSLETSDKFKTLLQYMECAIIQNVMTQKQILYRMHPESLDTLELSNLTLLTSFLVKMFKLCTLLILK